MRCLMRFDVLFDVPCKVLSAAGAVDHDALVKLAEEKFNALPQNASTVAGLVSAVSPLFRSHDFFFFIEPS